MAHCSSLGTTSSPEPSTSPGRPSTLVALSKASLFAPARTTHTHTRIGGVSATRVNNRPIA
jgi:hypothetical protein